MKISKRIKQTWIPHLLLSSISHSSQIIQVESAAEKRKTNKHKIIKKETQTQSHLHFE